MASEAQHRAQAKYAAKNVTMVSLKLNRKTDADILELFEREGGSRQGIIKQALREYIEKRKTD